MLRGLAVLLLALTCTGCSFLAITDDRPSNTANACSMFREKPAWADATREAQRRWGVPVALQLAIIKQESAFQSDVRPPRIKFLWVIPLWRPSSAYGYPQALDSTWELYQDQAGSWFSERDDFEDAADFVGWYCARSSSMLSISKDDGYHQYIAYHEGQGGYRSGRWKGKSWLKRVARKVAAQQQRYAAQLRSCGY